MDPVTKEQFSQLPEKTKGFVSYMQSSWNPNIPKENPHVKDSKKWKEWEAGVLQGVLEAQDSEE